MTSDLPEISIAIVTRLGVPLLESCLGSLLKIDYPRDRIEILVHDNAATKDVATWASGYDGNVRVVRSEVNLGFAEPCNGLARMAAASRVCFLNDDMSFAPDFLHALVAAQEETGAACVGATILDSTGESLEYAGGSLALTGHGSPQRHGCPVGDLAGLSAPEETLFASGGAMLVDRATFLDVGGFDPEYFAYYEDVDFGWRLHILGERVAWAPAARCRHRGHASEESLGPDGRMFLLERNALLSVVKNYEDCRVESILAFALALNEARGRFDAGRSRACERGRQAAISALPAIRTRRRELARRRSTEDARLLPLFVDPWRPEIPGAAYAGLRDELAYELGITRFVEESLARA